MHFGRMKNELESEKLQKYKNIQKYKNTKIHILLLAPQGGAHRITPHRDLHPKPKPIPTQRIHLLL